MKRTKNVIRKELQQRRKQLEEQYTFITLGSLFFIFLTIVVTLFIEHFSIIEKTMMSISPVLQLCVVTTTIVFLLVGGFWCSLITLLIKNIIIFFDTKCRQLEWELDGFVRK